MSRVDWDSLVGTFGATTVFSNLSLPDKRLPFEKNVACLRLRGGKMVDIEWRASAKKYIVKLYADEYQTLLKTLEADTASSVVQYVTQLASPAWNDRRYLTASGSGVITVREVAGFPLSRKPSLRIA